MKRSLNFFAVCGRVVKKISFKKSPSHKRLFACTRLRLRSQTGTRYTYVDLYAFGDTAKEMNLVCSLGNVVYAECHITNKIYANKKGQTKAKMYFMVDRIDLVCLNGAKVNIDEIEAKLEILSDLDPSTYIDD